MAKGDSNDVCVESQLYNMITSKLHLLRKHFSNECDDIMSFLVANGIYDLHSELYQEIMHLPMTNFKRLSLIIEKLPIGDVHAHRSFMRGVEQTPRFQSKPAYYRSILRYSQDPMSQPGHILGPSYWEDEPKECLCVAKEEATGSGGPVTQELGGPEKKEPLIAKLSDNSDLPYIYSTANPRSRSPVNRGHHVASSFPDLSPADNPSVPVSSTTEHSIDRRPLFLGPSSTGSTLRRQQQAAVVRPCHIPTSSKPDQCIHGHTDAVTSSRPVVVALPTPTVPAAPGEPNPPDSGESSRATPPTAPPTPDSTQPGSDVQPPTLLLRNAPPGSRDEAPPRGNHRRRRPSDTGVLSPLPRNLPDRKLVLRQLQLFLFIPFVLFVVWWNCA